MRRAATSAASAAAARPTNSETGICLQQQTPVNSGRQTAPAEGADAAAPADAVVTPEPSPVETPQMRRTAKRAALAAAIAAVVARVNKKQEALEASQAQLADLQAQLDTATTAKAETEAQLAALEHQVNGVTSELEPLAAEESGEAPTVEVEEGPTEGVSAKGAALERPQRPPSRAAPKSRGSWRKRKLNSPICRPSWMQRLLRKPIPKRSWRAWKSNSMRSRPSCSQRQKRHLL